MIKDQYGLIRAGTDGGDTCHRMYTVELRKALLKKLGLENKIAIGFQYLSPDYQTQLEPKNDGIYIRNPAPTWESDPLNNSRDQETPVICKHAATGDTAAQTRFLKAALKRKMFAQNVYPNGYDSRIATESENKKNKKMADFLLFDLWGVIARTYIKSRYAPLALPVIILGDAFLVLASLFKVFAPMTRDGSIKPVWPGPDDVDDENINNILQTTQHVFPTPLSYLARKIYKTFRRKNYGNTVLNEKDAVMGALAWYNRNDNPEITELTRPLVERY